MMRPYQELAVTKAKTLLAKPEVKTLLLVSPTGSGKTFIANEIIGAAKCLIVVNRQTLLDQWYDAKTSCIVHNDLVKNVHGEKYNKDPNMPRHILIVDSMENIDDDFDPELIVIDEAHKGTSSRFQQLRAKYPNAKILGLTATPGRMKSEQGESLIEWYGDNVIIAVTVRELIEQGYLVQPVYYRFTSEDHVFNEWNRLTANETNKKTIIFTTDTNHSLKVLEAARLLKIRAAIITASEDVNQTYNERNRIIEKFKNGEIDVLISVMALCEGFDVPETKNCILLRSVSDGNYALYQQIIGRVLRPFAGKISANVLDFADNIERFGPVEDHIWDSIEDKIATPVLAKNGAEITEHQNTKRILMACDCGHVYDYKKSPVCGHCGTKMTVSVVRMIADVRDEEIKKINPTYWKGWLGNNKSLKSKNENVTKAFKSYLESVDRNRKNWSQFNDKIAEVFQEGNLPSYYEYLIKNRNKMKMDDTIRIEL